MWTQKRSLAFLPHLPALAPSSFTASAIWRDLYSFTGSLRTFYGPDSILTVWNATRKVLRPSNFSLLPNSAQIFRAGPACWIQETFDFEIEKTNCQAILALVQDEKKEWKIWLLRTILMELKGEGVGSVDSLPEENIKSGTESKNEGSHFDCVVIGGGQAGLGVAGRLKALGLSCVVLEKNQEVGLVGDNWKLRYDSCALHLPRDTAHLPLDRTFGPEYSDYLTKNELAQGYKNWVTKYDINVWMNTTLEKGEWRDGDNIWILKVKQVGNHRIPSMPEYPNQNSFQGTILHSAHFKNSSAWKGRHGVIIGSGTTAHDIAEDMLGAGLASVTMVQRSPTYVIPAEYIGTILSHSYNAQILTSLADQRFLSFPPPVQAHLFKGGINHFASQEPERFDALEAVGFRVERDGSVAENLFERGGGHYVDVGASKKIADGLIKIKSDSRPTHYTPNDIAFEDNSILPADVVILATGYHKNLRPVVAQMFSQSIADAMGDFWGVDSEGEFLGANRPGGQKAMFYAGGSQDSCRYFSRFIALSIKADVMGSPLPVYEG